MSHRCDRLRCQWLGPRPFESGDRTLVQASAVAGVHQKLPSHATRRTIPAPTPQDASVTGATFPPRFRSSAPAAQLRSPRERVRAGGGDQALRHPVVDVAEAVEAPSLFELYSASYKEPR